MHHVATALAQAVSLPLQPLGYRAHDSLDLGEFGLATLAVFIQPLPSHARLEGDDQVWQARCEWRLPDDTLAAQVDVVLADVSCYPLGFGEGTMMDAIDWASTFMDPVRPIEDISPSAKLAWGLSNATDLNWIGRAHLVHLAPIFDVGSTFEDVTRKSLRSLRDCLAQTIRAETVFTVEDVDMAAHGSVTPDGRFVVPEVVTNPTDRGRVRVRARFEAMGFRRAGHVNHAVKSAQPSEPQFCSAHPTVYLVPAAFLGGE